MKERERERDKESKREKERKERRKRKLFKSSVAFVRERNLVTPTNEKSLL